MLRRFSSRDSRVAGDANRSEFSAKVIKVMRTSIARRGGRVMRNKVIVVVGNGKGLVGLGCGKGKDFFSAKNRAQRMAMRSLNRIYIRNNSTVHHAVITRYSSARVMIKPASSGTGVIAGNAASVVCRLVGLKDIIVKAHGARNVLNVASATIKALCEIERPRDVSRRRSSSVSEILGYSNS